MTVEINREVAIKVLATVDAGLSDGLGEPVPGKMCVEAAVCYAPGLPHSDDPGCVNMELREFKIKLNDGPWSSPAARAAGLRRLALVQLGSLGTLNSDEFLQGLAKLGTTKWLPRAFRKVAERAPDKRDALLAFAERAAKGEKVSTEQVSRELSAVVVGRDHRLCEAICTLESAADRAESYLNKLAELEGNVEAAGASYYMAKVAHFTSRAIAFGGPAERDAALAACAEDVVQLLIEMKAPGCEWLDLAPLPSA